MKTNITFLSSCLLLTSFQVFADRPAMQDRPVIQEPKFEVEQNRPAMETQPVVEQETQQSAMQTQTGDVLVMPATELRPGETLNIKLLDFPRRGMNMSKVQNELGRPVSISNTVGNPPITHWSYSDREVYFENAYVIHVVPR